MADAGTTMLTLVPVTVTTPGTAVRIPTSGEKFAAKTAIIQALPKNEEGICVGDENVKAEEGTHAAPKQRGVELAPKQTISIDICDSSAIWIDSRKAKDGVSVTLLLA